tara:strand:+ start:86 stop:322 length:237 start_codon:yes stop_codon:yes gene_type:complete
MITALEELKMKNIYLTPKRKTELIKSLSLDEKLYYGSWLNDSDNETFVNSEVKEVDGELSFGAKTFEDGVEVFTNNKY